LNKLGLKKLIYEVSRNVVDARLPVGHVGKPYDLSMTCVGRGKAGGRGAVAGAEQEMTNRRKEKRR
jgi:hypothetical protein